MVVVSVTLPSDLLRRFDSFARNRGYYSRSEGFRDALRSLMAESQLLERQSGKVIAAIVAIYEYPKKDVTSRLIQLSCDSDDIVIENLNRHLGEHHCLSVFVAEGTLRKIGRLAGRITGMRGIQQVKTIFIPAEKHVPSSGNAMESSH